MGKHRTLRNLVVDGQQYTYCIGRDSTIIFAADREKVVVGHADLTGMSQDAVEYAKIKGSFSITPSSITHYLRSRSLMVGS